MDVNKKHWLEAREVRGMKIVHVLAYYGDYLGGIQNYVRELAKRQRAEGHEVKIITSDLYGKQKRIDGVNIIRCKSWFSAFRVPFMPSLPFKLLNEKCDIVHVHLPLPGLDLACSLKKSIHKDTKLIITIHNDLQINSLISKIFGWIHNKFLISIAIKKSDFVITTTKSFADSLIYKIPKNKHRIIILGVDTNLFKDLGLKREDQVLFVGRIIPEKGLHLLIESIKEVRKDLPFVKLVVAYQNVYNYNEYYNSVTKEGKDFLIEKENCQPKELVKLYNQCKCLVLPSLQESFGTVFLESLACNCPVVAFDLPGPKEAFNNRVRWISLGDVNKLAQEIKKVMIAKKIDSLNNSIKDNFSWDKINKKILEVYKE
jgi:glycosyltransferase involved in cell wall biosynthesis